jgi:hypothetical protein
LYTGGKRREVESRELKDERKEENAETQREEQRNQLLGSAMKCEKRKRDSQE